MNAADYKRAHDKFVHIWAEHWHRKCVLRTRLRLELLEAERYYAEQVALMAERAPA